MNEKYYQWINQNVPFDLKSVTATCTHYTPLMQQAFPELKTCKGVVYSHDNSDNYSSTSYKQYPHMWLETSEGEIIDPTQHQFWLLGELIYEKAPEDVNCMNKCVNCGEYFYKTGCFCSDRCVFEYEGFLNNSRAKFAQLHTNGEE